ncbi:rhodanese-like domain-containing protein [Methylobacillus flagellatus]|uniref:rhodanese-like domain-containing protein n=1 Tax=Methylobacillus flagellatus TaxID=405 RepID=UPI002853924A|nr:rhodanese-like domain-containing protein [Methylobacillus flagellatus]MDR5172424.1 rhodanese-like domain-containing protein [Methylobacillus flagellatus]
MDFFAKNALWIGLAIGSGIMLLLPTIRRGAGAAVSASDAVILINRSHAVVLDVRDDAEFAAGHIADAKHIPLAQLPERLKELSKFKDKPVLVYCESGARAGKAAAILAKNEFKQVKQLQGGVKAWQDAKLPLVKG